jgi:NTE family protein
MALSVMSAKKRSTWPVEAVNVWTGNFVYFDNTERRLRPEHFIAPGALPAGFPAVEIDGEFYWDGGLISNTPLYWILLAQPQSDALARFTQATTH